MHIVFWSCMPGHAAVSSSMLSVACSCAGLQQFSTAVLQTQYNKNNLQYPFFKIADKHNVEQYNSVGMDSLIRTVKGGSILGGVETCAVSFMGARLSVYTQSVNNDGRAYYESLLTTMPMVFKSLDSAFDLAFIDTAAGNDPLSMEALKNADYMVVCLPQEEWIINYFFSKYNFNSDKVFYLFGNYDPKSSVTLQSLIKSKEYKQYFNSKNTAAIYRDIDFANSLGKSELVSFFLRGLDCDKKHPNYDYFTSAHDAARKILTFAGVVPRK